MVFPNPNIPSSYPGYMAPISNVQPFTYRDGQTYLEILEGMRVWLNVTLLPAIQTMVTDLGEEWADEYNQLVELVNTSMVTIDAAVVAAQLAETNAEASAEEAAASAAQAGTQQDNAITALFNNLTSAFRTATDLAYASKETQTTVETGRLSVASLLLKADKTYVDSADSTNATAINSVAGRATALELLTTDGRLGQSALDLRYLLRPAQPHAVFIGSSNSTVGTWPEQFCSEMGYVVHNYSVGGGGFTASSTGQFLAQINAAIADTSYDKTLVKFVFICDMGNDIRATFSVASAAPAVYAAAKTAYPNARLILVPALWGHATDNDISGRLVSISQRVNEARNAGLAFGVEMVESSWTWHGDNGNWMKPGEVHYTADGYTRIVQFMKLFMAGGDTVYNTGQKLIQPYDPVQSTSAYWRISRIGDIAHLENTFYITSDVAADANLGLIEYGAWPIDTLRIPVVNETNRTVYTIAVYNAASGGGTGGGLIRAFGAMTAGGPYNIHASWRVY